MHLHVERGGVRSLTTNDRTGAEREQRKLHSAWEELRKELISTHYDLRTARPRREVEDANSEGGKIPNVSHTSTDDSSESESASNPRISREPQMLSRPGYRLEGYLDAASLKAMNISGEEDGENMAPYNPSHLRCEVLKPFYPCSHRKIGTPYLETRTLYPNHHTCTYIM